MKSVFIFAFDNSRKNLCRKYKFDLQFSSKEQYEERLDWAEKTNDISEFLTEMEAYGIHDVEYNPSKEFFGIESGNINPKNYIKVMECWREFFSDHNIECGDIVEILPDPIVF